MNISAKIITRKCEIYAFVLLYLEMLLIASVIDHSVSSSAVYLLIPATFTTMAKGKRNLPEVDKQPAILYDDDGLKAHACFQCKKGGQDQDESIIIKRFTTC